MNKIMNIFNQPKFTYEEDRFKKYYILLYMQIYDDANIID